MNIIIRVLLFPLYLLAWYLSPYRVADIIMAVLMTVVYIVVWMSFPS